MQDAGGNGHGRRLRATQRADVELVADALASLLSSPVLAVEWARRAATAPRRSCLYDALAEKLASAIDGLK